MAKLFIVTSFIRQKALYSVATLLFAFIISVSLHATASAAPVVQPVSPTNNSYASGQVTLSSQVNGLQPSDYEMFWAVGDGEWNRLPTNPLTKVSTTTIDISGWNWKSDNTYVLRFIALIKNGWYPIESSVTIKKGTAPTPIVQSAPAVASAPAPAPAVVTPMPTLSITPQKTLYVDPNSTAAQRLSQNPTNPTLKYISSQPMARWFGNWNGNVTADVDEYVDRATRANAVPVVVLYNIPHRDCGSYSAGGSQSYSNYLDWVRRVNSGLAGREAIVIVEPDALAGLDCLEPSERTARTNAISQAVTILKNAQTKVYIDAGHSQWHTVATMATRLKNAGIQAADGFSLNVSNFHTTSSNTTYGNSLSAQVGDKHFVMDTSRNGNGATPTGEWCNPSGRALGKAPTTATGVSLIDAYLWVKTPGESDGACGNGAPGAGQWWQPYADELYRNSL